MNKKIYNRVRTKRYRWQYSNYWDKSAKHYANAMMNDKYSGRVRANAGKWAKADSPEAWGDYDTHKSWYGHD